MNPDEIKVAEIVKEYSSNKRALILSEDEQYIKATIEGNAKNISVLTNKSFEYEDIDVISNINFDDYIELCESTGETFDLIVFHSDIYKSDLQNEHKELIRRLQNNLLNNSGILIFISRIKDFVLDQYLKPGADKLTKKVLDKDLEEKPFQVWAFYN